MSGDGVLQGIQPLGCDGVEGWEGGAGPPRQLLQPRAQVGRSRGPAQQPTGAGLKERVDGRPACSAVSRASRSSRTSSSSASRQRRLYPGRTIRIAPDPTGDRRQTTSMGLTDHKLLGPHGPKVASPKAPWRIADKLTVLRRFIHPAEAGAGCGWIQGRSC